MAHTIFDYSFRVIVVGDSNTGKSSLVRYFVDRKAVPKTGARHRPTVGADHFMRVIQAAPKCSTRVRLEIWDTAGQERYRAITKSYYRNSIGVVLVFDVTNRNSFNHIPEWFEESRVHVLPHKAVYILIGNKVDLKPRAVTTTEAEEFAEDIGLLYFETSSVTGQRIDEGFITLGHTIFEKLKSGEIMAESGWAAVKDQYTADQKVKLGASNRDDHAFSGTRCG